MSDGWTLCYFVSETVLAKGAASFFFASPLFRILNFVLVPPFSQIRAMGRRRGSDRPPPEMLAPATRKRDENSGLEFDTLCSSGTRMWLLFRQLLILMY